MSHWEGCEITPCVRSETVVVVCVIERCPVDSFIILAESIWCDFHTHEACILMWLLFFLNYNHLLCIHIFFSFPYVFFRNSDILTLILTSWYMFIMYFDHVLPPLCSHIPPPLLQTLSSSHLFHFLCSSLFFGVVLVWVAIATVCPWCQSRLAQQAVSHSTPSHPPVLTVFLHPLPLWCPLGLGWDYTDVLLKAEHLRAISSKEEKQRSRWGLIF